MYKEYYQLRENPFNVTADPSFFFSSNHHEEAYSNLVYGIQQRKGILAITGEVGTGKTTLCRTLLGRLDSNVKTALILNPKFSETQLLRLIIKDLGINTSQKSKFALINLLNDFLIEETNHGNNVVLIVDEAQNLTVKQLENIRMLSNLETEKDKLLQIILVGQPELDEKLKLPALRQLTQRITVRYKIMPLTKPELRSYLEHRINLATEPNIANNKPHFTDDALDSIYDITNGTPRIINILCERALLAGYIAETKILDGRLIKNTAKEVFLQ